MSSPSRTFISPWILWGCAGLFYAFQFALRVSPTVMSKELFEAFQVGPYELGLLGSIYYYGYAALQIPAGALVDKFGPKRNVLLALLLCVLGSLLFVATSNFTLALIGRLAIGIGSAFAFLACFKIITVWFHPSKLPLLVGSTFLIGTCGALGAGAPLAMGVNAYGWKTMMVYLVAGGAMLWVLSAIVLKDKPGTTANQKSSLLKNTLLVLKNRQSWLIGTYGALMYVPLAAFCDLWGVSFLTDVYGIDKGVASGLVPMVYLGLGLSAPFSGALSNVFQSYRKPLILGSVATSLVFLFFMMQPSYSYLMFALLLLLLGVAMMPQFLTFSLMVDVNSRELGGTAGGVNNMFSMLSGVIFQPLIGFLLSYFASTWSTQMCYRAAFISIPLATILASILPFFIKDTWAKDHEGMEETLQEAS
jgi:sugar phosphate permease